MAGCLFGAGKTKPPHFHDILALIAWCGSKVKGLCTEYKTN